MAKSPAGELFEGLQKFLANIHTIDWLVEIATGKKMPDTAPTAAKVAVGFLHSGDEVVLQILLEELAKDDKRDGTNHRENIINFLFWLRARNKEETVFSKVVAGWYFNGFRVKVTKMHEASKGTEKKTIPGKKGEGSTTVESSTYNRESDGGLMFLRRISEVIEANKKSVVAVDSGGTAATSYDYTQGYEEAVKFLTISGISVMPDLSALAELRSQLMNIPKEAISRFEKWEKSESDKYFERVARRHPIVAFFKKFL